jgi:ankyrin repeat protein
MMRWLCISVITLSLTATTAAIAGSPNDQLWSAASHGDLEGVKSALEDGADVDYFKTEERLSALHVAAMDGHADVVALLLKRGANINIVDNTGDTPLNTALMHKKKSVVEVLVANGANVRHAGTWGYTPLHQAARNDDPDTAKLLLEHGADPNAMDPRGDTPLDAASSAPVADVLLTHGARVSAVAADGTTLLQAVDRDLLMAVVAGDAKGVRSAVSRGAHVNIRDGLVRETPLIRAVYLGRLDAATALLNAGADIEEANENRQTPLHIAVGQGHLKLVELLLSHRANVAARDFESITPLGLAGDADIAQVLLRAGANPTAAVNLVCGFGTDDVKLVELLLSYGMDANPRTGCSGDTPLLTAVSHRRWDVATTLLNHGAEPNARDDHGWTPLFLAAGSAGSAGLVARLLERGANPNTPDKDGNTPLIEAAQYGRPEVVKLLIAAGANMEAKNQAGITALAAAEDVETLDLLVAGGANIEDVTSFVFGKHVDLDDRQRRVLKAIVTGTSQSISTLSTSEITKPFPDGYTALQLAALFGRIDLSVWLIDHGTDVSATNADGMSALHIAVGTTATDPQQKIRLIKLLLKRGAGIDVADKDGHTPLHLAAAIYNNDAVVCLLENGADPFRRAKDGLTPLQLAQRSEHGTGLLGLATAGDETQKSATIDALRAAMRARP